MSDEILDSVDKNDYLIAVDRGALWLLERGIVPAIAIGDFDSVNKEELSLIKKKIKKVLIYTPRKNYSDMELAVRKAISFRPEEIIIFGATGSRLDHTLASLNLLEFPADKKIKTRIMDTHNEISLIGKKVILEPSDKFKFFSLIPLTSYAQVSISGSLYDLSNKIIKKASSRSVSNEIVNKKCQIDILRGKVLLVRSRD